MCSAWPFLSLHFNSDTKLQKTAAVFCLFYGLLQGEKNTYALGSRWLWVSSSKAKVERYFSRTISPHTLWGIFADLQWAPQLQLTTHRQSLQSYSNEGRVFLSPYSPSYFHPMDLSCSMLPPMFWKSPDYEFTTIWISNLIQIYLLLPTSVLIFNEANCSVWFGREPRKTRFWFSVHLNTRQSRNIILPANWSQTADCC